MKKTILFIFGLSIIFFVASCKSETTNEDENQDTTENVVNDHNVEKQDDVVELEMLKFDPSIVNKLSGIEGDLLYGYKWKDKAGLNLLIFTREEKFVPWPDAEYDDMGDNFVYLKAYHFSGTDDSYSLVRLVQDGETEGCGSPPFALECDFFEKSISITDLNKNGYAEATFMYYNLCSSELSPIPTKLMMLENGEKYAIRGNSYIVEFDMGGEKNIDFGDADKELLDYASQTWDKFCTTKS